MSRVQRKIDEFDRVRLGKPETVSKHTRTYDIKPRLDKKTKDEIKYGKAKRLTTPKEKYGIKLSPFLEPYTDETFPPNKKITIPSSSKKDNSPTKKSYDINLRFYGKYKGEPFGPEHLTKENFDISIPIHDAPHSVALFLNEMKSRKNKKFAIHTKIPFEFPFGTEYIKYYTQKYDFPLVIVDVNDSRPVEEQLITNGVPAFPFNRWCTRVYKTSPTKSFYKNFDLDGIEERMGMNKYQSDRRADKNPEKHISQKSTGRKKDKATGEYTEHIEKFKIYESLPIFEMRPEEMEQLMENHNIKESPIIKKFGYHGCMYCPVRKPQYYYNLKKNHQECYKQCDKWRQLGSKRKNKDPNKKYYWFSEGKGSRLSKKLRKENPELINIM